MHHYKYSQQLIDSTSQTSIYLRTFVYHYPYFVRLPTPLSNRDGSAACASLHLDALISFFRAVRVIATDLIDMSTAPCVSSLTGGVRAPVARPPTRGARSCVTATRATSFSPSADRLSISGDVEADGRVVVVAADSEKRRGNLVDALKRSAAAVAAAAVVATAQPDAACANGYEPPPPTNGPAARLPRGANEPSRAFFRDSSHAPAPSLTFYVFSTISRLSEAMEGTSRSSHLHGVSPTRAKET